MDRAARRTIVDLMMGDSIYNQGDYMTYSPLHIDSGAIQPQEIAQTLRDAGDWLDTHHHAKGYLWDRDEDPTEACARGAIIITLGYNGSYNRNALTHEELQHKMSVDGACEFAVLEHLQGRALQGFTDWNDKKIRTKEEVIKAFYETADKIEVSE